MLALTLDVLANPPTYTALPGRIHLISCGRGISGIFPDNFAFRTVNRQATSSESRTEAPRTTARRMKTTTQTSTARLRILMIGPRSVDLRGGQVLPLDVTTLPLART